MDNIQFFHNLPANIYFRMRHDRERKLKCAEIIIIANIQFFHNSQTINFRMRHDRQRN